MESVFRIPKRHKDVCVDRRRHSSSYPRSSRIHFCTAFLPFPIPGLPIPMYFAKGLSFRTAVTRIPFPSSSNCNRSPARTPSRRRTSRGMVICPLLVTFACFFIATFSSPTSSFCLLVSSFPSPISLLYHAFLTSELVLTKRCGSCLFPDTSPPPHLRFFQFSIDKKRVPAYSISWVILCPPRERQHPCWRFCFPEPSFRPKPFIRNTYETNHPLHNFGAT